ncbi:hypothetical protein [Bacillus toyonensis]|uniref:hypothetical protein n=1 Tax=Bacillus toyonensis TaxID=155322 RepID=UPI000BFB8192|nr:hypothetical protein [Bacillus toyonensis]PHE23613.1 hypothetical protein COF73_29250 [Bacillus toyonensis]
MDEFKENFQMKIGKEKKFYVHTNEHECKFEIKKVHTENEEKIDGEKIMEWTSSKNTAMKFGVGIGTTVTVVVNWISNFF